MQGPFLRKYGVETKIDFTLYGITGLELKVDAAHASGDTKIMKDEGAEGNTTNGFVDEGQGYSITLTATEMEAARIVVYIVDQSTKTWIDTFLVVETYGNPSAQHAFDLSVATQKTDVETIKTQAVTCSAGVTVGAYVGGTGASALASEVTSARMGALTDLIDGGRLDLLIDAIKVMTDKIGTVTNTGGTATIGALLGDFANSALVTRLAKVNANVVEVNEIEIGGSGTEIDPFGPVA